MMDWFSKELPKGTRIIPSENGFTSDKIAQVFLQHYIDHSDSRPEADWKIMLMDNDGSHCTPEFIALANINHIRPYLKRGDLLPAGIHYWKIGSTGATQRNGHN